MNTEAPLYSSAPDLSPSEISRPPRSRVSWGAILAGFFSALALQFVFMLLGAGLGLAMYSPLRDENPAANLGAGMVIIEAVSAVVSLWLGGWVAGRLTPVGARTLGGVHGFVVWSIATIAGLYMVGSGASFAASGLAKVVGAGMNLASKPMAAAASTAVEGAKDSAGQSGSGFSSYIDEAVAGRSADSTPGATIRAKRQITSAVAKYFSPLAQTDPTASRAALVKALSDNGGMSEADANRTVTEWTDSANQLKADATAAKDEAAAKARVAADKASRALSIASLCTFGALMIGAIAATFGGKNGALAATRRHTHDEAVVGDRA